MMYLFLVRLGNPTLMSFALMMPSAVAADIEVAAPPPTNADVVESKIADLPVSTQPLESELFSEETSLSVSQAIESSPAQTLSNAGLDSTPIKVSTHNTLKQPEVKLSFTKLTSLRGINENGSNFLTRATHQVRTGFIGEEKFNPHRKEISVASELNDLVDRTIAQVNEVNNLAEKEIETKQIEINLELITPKRLDAYYGRHYVYYKYLFGADEPLVGWSDMDQFSRFEALFTSQNLFPGREIIDPEILRKYVEWGKLREDMRSKGIPIKDKESFSDFGYYLETHPDDYEKLKESFVRDIEKASIHTEEIVRNLRKFYPRNDYTWLGEFPILLHHLITLQERRALLELSREEDKTSQNQNSENEEIIIEPEQGKSKPISGEIEIQNVGPPLLGSKLVDPEILDDYYNSLIDFWRSFAKEKDQNDKYSEERQRSRYMLENGDKFDNFEKAFTEIFTGDNRGLITEIGPAMDSAMDPEIARDYAQWARARVKAYLEAEKLGIASPKGPQSNFSHYLEEHPDAYKSVLESFRRDIQAVQSVVRWIYPEPLHPFTSARLFNAELFQLQLEQISQTADGRVESQDEDRSKADSSSTGEEKLEEKLTEDPRVRLKVDSSFTGEDELKDRLSEASSASNNQVGSIPGGIPFTITPEVLGGDRGGSLFGGGVNLFLPFGYNSDNPNSTFYAIVHAGGGTNGVGGFNLGLGGRRAFFVEEDRSNALVAGFNIFYDHGYSEFGNTYNRGGVGLEFLSNNFEANLNGYIPEGHSNVIGSRSLSTLIFPVDVSGYGVNVAQQTFNLNALEYALPGFDLQLGYRYNFNDRISASLHGGFFYFDREETPTKMGPQARLQVDVRDIFGPGTQLSAGARMRHESEWGTDAEGFVRVSIPFGNVPKQDKPLDNVTRLLATDYINRDYHIETFHQDINRPVSLNDLLAGNTLDQRGPQLESVTTRFAKNPFTGQILRVLFVDADRNTGIGTQADPLSLAQANSISVDGDVYFFIDDAGPIDTAFGSGQTLKLKPNQIVLGVGDNTNFTAELAFGNDNILLPVTVYDVGRPWLFNSSNNPVITLSNFNEIKGIGITRGRDGIFGDSGTGGKLSDVTIQDTDRYGVYLHNWNSYNASNIDILDTGAAGIYLNNPFGSFNFENIRVRLNLETSFTGEDLLRRRLEDGEKDALQQSAISIRNDNNSYMTFNGITIDYSYRPAPESIPIPLTALHFNNASGKYYFDKLWLNVTNASGIGIEGGEGSYQFNRVRLNLDTSFTGEDLLRAPLLAIGINNHNVGKVKFKDTTINYTIPENNTLLSNLNAINIGDSNGVYEFKNTWLNVINDGGMVTPFLGRFSIGSTGTLKLNNVWLSNPNGFGVRIDGGSAKFNNVIINSGLEAILASNTTLNIKNSVFETPFDDIHLNNVVFSVDNSLLNGMIGGINTTDSNLSGSDNFTTGPFFINDGGGNTGEIEVNRTLFKF